MYMRNMSPLKIYFRLRLTAVASRILKSLICELEHDEEQEEGMRFYFLEKVKPQGVVELPNLWLMAEILALSWILVLQSQSLVRIPRG